MVFNIDENMILETIGNALESAGSEASEDQFNKIANAINDKFPSVISLLAYGMQEHWKNEAMGTPTGWGKKYAAAIKAEVTGNKAVVYVDEEMIDKQTDKPNMMFVNMVENGMKSFSIKDALLKSDKAKIGPNGVKYIIVPFPVSTPRKENQGKMQSHFGGREMTNEMHKIVKGGGRISGKLKSGQEVSGLSQYNTRQLHSQYGIFIRVSQQSKGWIHPGVPASPVFPSVLKEVNAKVAQMVGEFCKAIVQEYTK